MIGKLRGIVDSLFEHHVILDVSGVGYLVYASGKTLAKLAVSEAAMLVIETHVREDHIHLYGFAAEEERHWFVELMTVKGVGAKMALGILSAMTPGQVSNAIAAQDKTAFRAVSGVGPKLAERIVLELKSKVGGIAVFEPVVKGSAKIQVANPLNDAVSALSHLGYSRTEAFTVAARMHNDNPNADEGALIRLCLKELAR